MLLASRRSSYSQFEERQSPRTTISSNPCLHLPEHLRSMLHLLRRFRKGRLLQQINQMNSRVMSKTLSMTFYQWQAASGCRPGLTSLICPALIIRVDLFVRRYHSLAEISSVEPAAQQKSATAWREPASRYSLCRPS
jgi:hypothetical protein